MKPEAVASGSLTDAQVRMFEAFGYLHCKQAFTAAEMADIIRDAESGRAEGLARADGRELISGKERLTALLLEDDRSGGAVGQLMKAMGEMPMIGATAGRAAGCFPAPTLSGERPRMKAHRKG